MKLGHLRLSAAGAILGTALFAQSAGATVTLVQTSDPGFYNNNIGNLLDLSNTHTDTCAEPFPTGNDCNTSYPTAPDLSAASAKLGNWLGDPGHLNSFWSPTQIPIPNSWPVSTEVAVIYEFDTLGATGVLAKFGVDNGIFVWLDGNYLLGGRAAGGVGSDEYEANIGTLSAGTHYLQLLLEDHGASNGYAVNISADTFIPGPPPSTAPTGAPEPITISLFGAGLAGAVAMRRRRKNS